MDTSLEQFSEKVRLTQSLPVKPSPVTLHGEIVTLRPLDIEKDAELLYLISHGSSFQIGGKFQPEYDANEQIWKLMRAGPFETVSDFRKFLIHEQELPDLLMFTVFDSATNHPIGSVSLINNEPEHLKVEIGWLWFSPIAQRTWANTEACLLLFTHVFSLGYRRFQWKCHVLNHKSREAALKLGFIYELTQQNHTIFKGQSRDTIWFRILDKEWEQVKKNIERRIYPRISIH